MQRRVSRNRIMAAALGMAALLAIVAAAAADARQVGAGKGKRPNILVIMTDDMATTDLALMPKVQRLLVRRGTTFADAVDSFPLCCPARATFITGQYAHNHGVNGNFAPYGWYGMRGRKNILPRWLKRSGYRTAMIGKWLNGYGARNAHGEIPKGFDIWRGLLDVSAYDYYNYVMNRNGKLKAYGDKKFARGLVKFAKIETENGPHTVQDIFDRLAQVFGPAPYHYWGKERTRDYSIDVTGKVTNGIVRAQRRSKKPFFVWWAPAAPHREDVAVTLMGRPGADPRPPHRYQQLVQRFDLPQPPSFNEADISDKGSPVTNEAALMNQSTIDQLELNYQGRVGGLRAVDDGVARLMRTLRRTRQLRNTLVMFVSDNGWLQGEHRIPGDKFLPYEESLRVPLVFRGPGVPKNKTIEGQVSNIDFAPTLLDLANAKAGRKQDGVSLLPTIRKPSRRPNRVFEIEALAPLFEGNIPVNAWDQPYTGVRTDRYTYVVWTDTAEEELYDRQTDPYQLTNEAANPAYAAIKAQLASKLTQLKNCSGAGCRIAP